MPTWSVGGGMWPVTYKANMVNMVSIWQKEASDPLNMFELVNVAI